MTQAFFRADAVSYQLLQLFDFREPALFFSVEKYFLIHGNRITPACFGRQQRNAFQLFGKRSKQFLRHVGSAQQPAAFWAIFDGDNGFHAVSGLVYFLGILFFKSANGSVMILPIGLSPR